jgi:hypothetical protein
MNMVTDNLKLSEEEQTIFSNLTSEEQEVFMEMRKARLKELGVKKRSYVRNEVIPANNYKWKIKDIELIKDEYLKKLIRHFAQLKFDSDLEFAIKLKYSEEHDAIFRYIGYSIYLGQDEGVIARNFSFKKSQIAAIKHLFFDFSNKPTSSVANAAYLRQLVHNENISVADFEFYKIIEELGEVGLKARSNIHSLTDEEKHILKIYLSYSMLENVLNIKSSIRTMKDALSYNGVVNSFNGFCMAQENLKLLKAREENIIASTEKIKTLNNQAAGQGMLPADKENIEILEELRKRSLKNNPPPATKTLADLQNLEVVPTEAFNIQ